MESCPQWHHRLCQSCQLEDVHNKDWPKLQKSITLKRIMQFCCNFYCNVFSVFSVPWKHANGWVSEFYFTIFFPRATIYTRSKITITRSAIRFVIWKCDVHCFVAYIIIINVFVLQLQTVFELGWTWYV